MYRLLATLCISTLILSACSSPGAPTANDRREKILSMDAKATPESRDRKLRSEAVLRGEGVPLNLNLPVIDSEQEAKRRSRDEVAYRALALLVVAAKGHGLEQRAVDDLVTDLGLEKHFSPNELRFVKSTAPTKHDRIQFTWRYEAAWVMLWALGYVEKLEKPTAVCDVQRAVKFLQARSTKQFLAEAKLRSMAEMLDQADLIYRYHWAVTDARLKSKVAPASLEPGVTMERHYALNWLIGYTDQAWDDISTDT